MPRRWTLRAGPADARLARHRFHLIEAGRFTSALAPESKGKPDIELLTYLHGAGRSETEKWLARRRRQHRPARHRRFRQGRVERPQRCAASTAHTKRVARRGGLTSVAAEGLREHAVEEQLGRIAEGFDADGHADVALIRLGR